MPRRHHPPAHLRYLKARLWNLARPGFWGTAIFLSVVGLVIKEYWTHPDFFTYWQKNQVAANKPANSSLSEEDRAIAADIDNLPILFKSGSDQENSPAAKTLDPTQNTQAKNSKGLSDTLNRKNPTSASESTPKANEKEGNSAPTQKLENPFVVQAENLLRFTNVQSGSKSPEVNGLTPSFSQQDSQNSFGLGTELANKTIFNQNIASQSALQTALNQSKQNQPNFNSTTLTPINPFEPSQLSTQNRRGQTLPSTGSSRDTMNPFNTETGSTQSGLSSGTAYTQPGITNFPQNFISGTGYPQPGLNNQLPQNPIPGTAYTQPGITNIPQTPSSIPNSSANILNQIRRNRLNNINSIQQLPSVAQPTSVVPPTSATSTNIAPYYTPQNQGSVTPNTPAILNNYGNSVLQQAPAPVPQYIYSSPRQIPGQYTGGGQINR
ncbi:hypothetical protein [Mastigocladopsis repens]|uniref:hypothetical protein n=1 Tax=Mastigocladopsis repens TaxID=221287 RepID=UPI0002E9C760|nr:hypothetical protein [Mastigocladopsis repens]